MTDLNGLMFISFRGKKRSASTLFFCHFEEALRNKKCSLQFGRSQPGVRAQGELTRDSSQQLALLLESVALAAEVGMFLGNVNSMLTLKIDNKYFAKTCF